MKQPTLKQLIESAEKEVNPADWYRKKELMTRFVGLKKSTLDFYTKEMEEYPEFREGIIKPTHSVTWINYYTFIWYLKWKDANKYVSQKSSPQEVLI